MFCRSAGLKELNVRFPTFLLSYNCPDQTPALFRADTPFARSKITQKVPFVYWVERFAYSNYYL